MEKSKRNLALLIFSAFLLLFPHVIISTAALDQEKQSVSDKFRGLYSVVTSSSMSCWQKLKTLVNDVQLRYFPPSLDFRPKVEEEIEEQGSKEWMKEAVKKSLGSSKSTVEETAKSAASAVGEVVHKTKEKVAKKQCTGDGCPHEEL
ncbi:hypothetical protein DCAR_0101309 [Daucus carota subsp. sativus]|uniref:Transmembrane protein n=1 Tax=Daucus carota subsp. sativus TaxID=79200 RepID=A0AAF0W2L5_DAUCS|nr:PREDICTED: uncharacterized protein LOC108198230 [Daucus carota subsp. sativus]WOG82147.1 hypothetical protein DCAR_0101309 [Daucus carota subsp. sativus]